MAVYKVKAPDGTVLRFEGPDNASTEQIAQAASAQWGSMQKPTADQKLTEELADPTAGMSVTDKLLAGVGKAFYDTGRGIGQLVGAVSRDDVKEARRLDAPLMNTKAGTIGNLAGNVALLAPTAAIPGANTVTGAGAIGALTGLIQPSASTGETLANVALGGAGGAGGQALANKLPGVVQKWAQGKTDEAANLAAQNAQKFDAARRGNSLGYVVPPADLNPGALTEALSGLSGKIKTAQVASQRNQSVTDKLAREALGLKAGDELSADVLQAIRQKAGQAYDIVKGAGTVKADKTFMDALDNIASVNQGAGRSFPGLQNNGVVELVASLKQAAFDAGDAVDATKVLREVADRAYRQGDTALGKAAKSASDAVEGMLERHLQQQGANDALKAFQEARKLIAKTYTVQKSLNSETGSVSAQKLAQELTKGKPLSGELLDIAKMGQAFPKATQALKEAPKAVSPLDFAVSGGAAMASQNPLALLALGARPAARNYLLSQTAQRAALANTPQVSSLLRIAPKVANNRLAQLLGLPLGVEAGLAAGNLVQQ